MSRLIMNLSCGTSGKYIGLLIEFDSRRVYEKIFVGRSQLIKWIFDTMKDWSPVAVDNTLIYQKKVSAH